MARRLLLVSVFVVAATMAPGVLAAGSASRGPDGAEEKVVPAESCRGLFIVPVRFGDAPEQTMAFALDTGASGTSVDPDSVRRVFGRDVRIGRSIGLRDGTAGPLTMNRLSARVHEMDHIARALGRDLDGILGNDTFRDLLLTLDYPAGEVRVSKGRLPEPDGLTTFRDVGRKKRPYLVVEVGGHKFRVSHNSFFQGNLGAAEQVGGDCAHAYSIIQRTGDVLPGLGNLNTDPLLDADYHLESGSPGIDAGLQIADVLVDIDGEARPAGSAVDIGADEFSP